MRRWDSKVWRRERRFARTAGETCDDDTGGGGGGVDVCAVGVMTEDEEEGEEGVEACG